MSAAIGKTMIDVRIAVRLMCIASSFFLFISMLLRVESKGGVMEVETNEKRMVRFCEAP